MKVKSIFLAFMVMLVLVSCESDEEKFLKEYYVDTETESSVVTNTYVCNICGGAGYLPYAGLCQNCFGTGRVTATNTIQVEIPILIERKTGYVVFRGKQNTSCNLPSHHCSGFVPCKHDSNLCANCLTHGYKCHKVNHQGAH